MSESSPTADTTDDSDSSIIVFLIVCAVLAVRIYFFLAVALPLNHDGASYLGAARADDG